MNYKKWLENNTESLKGKTVVVTGSTGGLGTELCRFLAELGANLVLVNRSSGLTKIQSETLIKDFGVNVEFIKADLSNMDSVVSATEKLGAMPVDVFIHNAGAYSIPRYICDTGYDNVFQINFISPYYMIKKLLPVLRERKGRVVAVGSIAHNYSKSDKCNIDFASNPKASKVYGNAKRYLMFSLYHLFENESEATLSIAHPGISFTGITAHYPKLIFAVIKHPMKIIFMKPKKASLSVLRGVFENTKMCYWIGPRIFNVWGNPKKQKLKTAKRQEIDFIGDTAQKIYFEIGNKRV
ncbi:MAG: SDR family NAD(P)-dependent oxidoreductase [Clostridia bacterium]|nr:SDR family NAD(P)-dependent oxidoreductase [Clostridia bacterium]